MQKVQTDEFKILLFGNTYISQDVGNGCAWSKGSGERLQGHDGPLVTSPTQCRLLTTLKKRPVENSVRKGENAGNQHFLLFQ